MKKHSALISILATTCLAASTEFVVPHTPKAPVIDGKIDRSEWRNALLLSGAGTPMDARKTQCFMTWNQDYLFLAVSSETPPRGKLVTDANADSIVMDDSVEFWFNPPLENRTLEQGKFGEFQLIASHTGSILQQHHNPGYGLASRKWFMQGFQYANTIENDRWDFEAAIPAQAFGFEKLQEADWKILAVRNLRTVPSYQAPFDPVSTFTDSTNHPVWHLRKTATAVRHDYADAKTRLPLKFEATSQQKLTYEADLNGVRQTGSLPVTLNAPKLPAQLSMVIKDQQQNVVFSRKMKLKTPPDRVWTTPEAYITLEQDFEQGSVKQFVTAPLNTKVVATELPQLTEGRTKGSKAVRFTSEKQAYLCKGAPIPIPGNISMWLKTESNFKDGFRRFFSSDYRDTGYFGLQQQATYGMLFFHYFSGEKHNIVPPRNPVPGTWCHLSVNLLPQHVEYYFNGIKVVDRDLPFTLQSDKLGDLVLGGGEPGTVIDDYTVYGRTLSHSEIKVLAKAESKLSGTMSWYPTKNAIALDLSCTSSLFKDADLELTISTKTGQKVLSLDVPVKQGFHMVKDSKDLTILHHKAVLPKRLSEGDYIMSLAKAGTTDILMEKEFHVKYYPWFNNQLGRKDHLLQGFTPLKVKDNTISCVLRDYTIGKNGLPEQITSLGKDLLAAPVTLNLVKDGNVKPLPGSALKSIRKRSDTTVEYLADSPGLTVSGRMEQDGLLRLDLTFTESPRADRLYIDVPLKKEFAILYHAVGEHIRSNPAGFIPEGQGTIFKSRSIPQIRINNFIPYIWIGEDERGICYAADWDKGWIHCKERDAVELFRHENGDVSIRLNIINSPFKLDKPRTITFVLMASPVKPMPKGWRGWADNFNYRGTRNMRVLCSPPYWGNYSGWLEHYPIFQDFSHIRKLVETTQTGKIDHDYISRWVERAMKASKIDASTLHEKTADEARNYVQAHTDIAFRIAASLYQRKNPVLYFYYCDLDQDTAPCPEMETMKDEWGPGSVPVIGSYQDFAIYYLDKMLEAGMRGVYNDNTFFRGDIKWMNGSGYITENGELHPSLGLWASREYRRRERNVMKDRGLEPWLTVHHTNANILPTLGFATNSMGMESKYGVTDFQTRYTPDYIRAVCQGLQGGFYPTVLDGIVGAKTPEQRTWVTRTMLASLLPHEVRPTIQRGSDTDLIVRTYNFLFDFGIWKDDCRYTAYWNPKNPVRSSDKDLLVSCYQRGKKLLIVCGSYAMKDLQAKLILPNVGQIHSAKNLETGAVLDVQGQTIAFPLKKHDFMLVEAQIGTIESEDLKMESRFLPDKTKEHAMVGWDFDKYAGYMPLGTATPLATPTGERGLRLKPNGEATALFHLAPIQIKKGDCLQYEFTIQGKGNYAIGFYKYTLANDNWLGANMQEGTIESAKPVPVIMTLKAVDRDMKIRPVLKVSGKTSDISFFGLRLYRQKAE